MMTASTASVTRFLSRCEQRAGQLMVRSRDLTFIVILMATLIRFSILSDILMTFFFKKKKDVREKRVKAFSILEVEKGEIFLVFNDAVATFLTRD